MHVIGFLLRMQFRCVLNLNELWAALAGGVPCSAILLLALTETLLD